MIDKEELLSELKLSIEHGVWTTKLTNMFYEIAGGVASNKLFSKYKYEADDFVQEGMLELLATWRKFDFEKSENAFGYFTKILFRKYMKLSNISDMHYANREYHYE